MERGEPPWRETLVSACGLVALAYKGCHEAGDDGAGDDAGSGASADLPAAARRSLLLAFYSHASPLLPRMCRAEGEVGAMEGKGGPGPRTSEVYMCSEVRCRMFRIPRHPCVCDLLFVAHVRRSAHLWPWPGRLPQSSRCFRRRSHATRSFR